MCLTDGSPHLRTCRSCATRRWSSRSRCGSTLQPGRWDANRRRWSSLDPTGCRRVHTFSSANTFLHRSPEITRTLQFDPERFTPEQKAVRPRFAYFPFGGIAAMHRRSVRVDGGRAGAGHDRAALAVPDGSGTDGGCSAEDHAAAEVSDVDGCRETAVNGHRQSHVPSPQRAPPNLHRADCDQNGAFANYYGRTINRG